MTNKEIRKKAHKLFLKHYKMMGCICTVVMMMNLVPNMLSQISWFVWIRAFPFSTLYTALTSPITGAGFMLLGLSVWDGEPPEFAKLTAFLKSRDLLIKAWLAGLLTQLPMQGYSILSAAANHPIFHEPENAGLLMVLMLITFVLSGVAVWVSMRLSLVYALLCKTQDLGVWESITTSWRTMKGNVRRVLAHTCVLILPLMLILLLLFIPLILTGDNSKILRNGPFSIFVIVMFGYLYYGYIFISQVGLYTELIKQS